MIDTHCHLGLCTRPVETILELAKQEGVSHMVNVATDIASAKAAQQLAQRYPQQLSATVGLYPGKKAGERELQQVREQAKTGRYCAIGEIGLDYFRVTTSPEEQKASLMAQLEMAKEYALPVIIHNRQADADIIRCVEAYPMVKKVFHCFASTWEVAEQLLHPNHYMSFTGMITYSKKGKTRRCIQQLPLDRIMVETDSPYLTPKVYHGQENQPAYVTEVAATIAHIKGLSVDDVRTQTTQTATSFFEL